MVDVNSAFLLFATIIIIGFLASKGFERFKIPDIIILMLLGVLLGPGLNVLGTESLESMRQLSSLFGTFVLLVLLVEGGMSLNYRTVLHEAAPSTLFTFLVFIANVVLVTLVGLIFGWNLLAGLLLGAILAGNSSSVVMSLVRRIQIKDETRTVLSLESSINDALVIVVAIAIIQGITTGSVYNPGQIAGSFFAAFTTSAFIAAMVGLIWLKALDLLRTRRYNYLLTLAIALFLYVFIESIGSNGAFAALIFGIILGNARIFDRMLKTSENVEIQSNLQLAQEEISFFVRTFFFVFLGLILDLSVLTVVTVVMAALIIVAKVAARYLSARVLERFSPEFTADEKILAVMLPNGLAAAAMASYPAAAGITIGGQDLFLQVAFLVILFSNIFASAAIFLIESKKTKSK